ncbi:hinge connector of long tail fiber protein distal connector [Morganella phage vB_MmoM_MP1]|uniref:Long tail fiber distal connector n=1 Tax=Morganella phage vB_MmoM_MP1 TaxID=1852628 RepID=A0A192YAC8_9CAUD|nr:hinge connector of long tail fiber protein distal connector [Morganella phage vB_MmoM_MP1]ANM46497.1 long tail fiber distal connector [Morganella phage vB_MmoM_MP1]
MAYLKSGSTVNGELILTQGNNPIIPVGDSVHYKEFKIFTEHDTPTAEQVDAVSKSKGGFYDKSVSFPEIIVKSDNDDYENDLAIRPDSAGSVTEIIANNINIIDKKGELNIQITQDGDVTILGDVTAKNFLITGNDTYGDAAVKRADVVLKGSIIDFGEF